MYNNWNKLGCQLTMYHPLAEVHTVNHSVQYVQYIQRVYGTNCNNAATSGIKLITQFQV